MKGSVFHCLDWIFLDDHIYAFVKFAGSSTPENSRKVQVLRAPLLVKLNAAEFNVVMLM